jgi:hypothetical protein
LSSILQAVKCHAASREKNEVANPSAIYAILSSILKDAILSNILIGIITERYKIIGDNTLRMIRIRYDS